MAASQHATEDRDRVLANVLGELAPQAKDCSAATDARQTTCRKAGEIVKSCGRTIPVRSGGDGPRLRLTFRVLDGR